MASPTNDFYACDSGRDILAGISTVRPFLGVVGHSMVKMSINIPGWAYGEVEGVAAFRWLNAVLRKPFDYPHCYASAATMGGPSAMQNGVYGLSSYTAASIVPLVPEYITQMTPYVGTRPLVVGLMMSANSIIAGSSGASIWGSHETVIGELDAEGWDVLLTEPVPSTQYGSSAKKTIVSDLQTLMRGAADSNIVDCLPWTDAYLDTGDANGYPVPLSGYTTDGLHINTSGAVAVAAASLATLAGRYPPWEPLASHVVCSWNPTLSGSSGTLGTQAYGMVPDNYTLSAPGSGCNVTGTQTGDGFIADWSYSGPAYAGSNSHSLIGRSYGVNFTVGSTVHEVIGDIEIMECENYNFQLVDDLGGGTGLAPASTSQTGLVWAGFLVGHRIVMHTEPFVAPTGMTKATASFTGKIYTGATSARLKVKFRWLGVKQV